MKKELKVKIVNWMMYWGVVGVACFVLMFLVTSTWIGVSVHDKCQVVLARYGGDVLDDFRTGWQAQPVGSEEWRVACVEALMETLENEEESLRERNNAIWALGQLGDRRALGVLKKYYTGVIPDREPYDETLSQYEMKKAIGLLDGGFNATAWVWR